MAVLVEPGRPSLAREMLGAAARLGVEVDGSVIALIVRAAVDPGSAGSWGADEVLLLDGPGVEEDVASTVSTWAVTARPWAILAPGTMWGREVASRVAARLRAGLTGDVVELTVERERLVGWKPAFGGLLVAGITAASAIQMVTLRPGAVPLMSPRLDGQPPVRTLPLEPGAGRVRILDSGRDDRLDDLVRAPVVVGVGTGVPPEEYGLLDAVLQALDAELGATRKVTDRGWLPRSRQIGITGRSIAPRLYVALGLSGNPNHLLGVRSAGTILAVNIDPAAPIFSTADVGMVADWRCAVPALVDELAGRAGLSAGIGP